MSEPRGRRSLGRRIRLTVLGATAGALLLAFGAFLTYQDRAARETLREEVKTLAKVVSIHSILPLARSEAEGAEATLRALGESPTIEAAAVFTPDGALFAQFLRDHEGGAPLPSSPGSPRETFHGAAFEVVTEIRSGGQKVGSVYLRASTAVLARRALHHLVLGAGVFVLASIPGLLASERLRRRIAAPLAAMADTAERVARGDLTLRFSAVASDGEIAALATAFERMTVHLRELVREVGTGVRAVVSATDALDATSQRTAEQASRQDASLVATTEAVEATFEALAQLSSHVGELFDGASTAAASTVEMEDSITTVSEHMDRLSVSIESTSAAAVQATDAVAQIARGLASVNGQSEANLSLIEAMRASLASVLAGAERSQKLSKTASDAAKQGRAAVDSTIGAIRAIDSDFAELRRIAASLAQSSSAIGQVLSYSEEMAANTRLLALNAAIIASQAGEQGRAFAVVAEKVKDLASGASESTREIAAVIDRVQVSTQEAVAAVNAASGKIERGVALSDQAGGILAGIAIGSEQSSATVASIASAVAAQLAELDRVREAAQEARASVARIHGAVDEHQRSSAAIAEAMQQAQRLGLGVKHSTRDQTREARRIAEVAAAIQELTRKVRDTTDIQHKAAEETLATLGVFRAAAQEAAQEAGTLHGLVEMLSTRSAVLAKQIDRFDVDGEDGAESGG